MRLATLSHIPWPENNLEPKALMANACDEVVLAEYLGFDSAWFAEHHFSRYGLGSSSLMVMSHIAAMTKTIELGTAVLLPALHNPIKFAEDTATLDVLSGGRLNVGFGRGTEGYEYHGYMVDWEESQRRFRETIQIVKNLWTQTDVEYDGEFHKIPKTNLVPRPLQNPHPSVFIAATRTEETLQYALQSGHMILSGPVADTGDAINMCQNFIDVASKSGSKADISEIPFFRYVYVAESEEQVKEDTEIPLQWTFDMIKWRRSLLVESEVNHSISEWKQQNEVESSNFDELLNNRVIVGTPDQCIEKILALKEIGIDYFGCNFAFGGLSHEKVTKGMKLFASEVMPHI